jgi:hypothetical protein
VKRSCEACSHKFEAKTKATRFCKDPGCIADRRRDQKRTERSSNVVDFPSSPPLGSVADATAKELEAAGKLDSTLGQAALVLARQLDSGTKDTGASKAAVARQLTALMVEATKGMKVADDPVDELQERRRRRLAGA